ncbi:hypothetical protein INR49_022226 [Caranx melampygus]|nr:hypothetical protein INR49_022226 [Caranx melampygus]
MAAKRRELMHMNRGQQKPPLQRAPPRSPKDVLVVFIKQGHSQLVGQVFFHFWQLLYVSTERLAVSVGCHLREVRCCHPAEAELEAVRLGEVALHSQADCLTRWGNQPAPVKHFFPAARHGDNAPSLRAARLKRKRKR